MRSLVLISTLFVCQTAASQAFYIPDSNPTTGTCNVIPFGNTTGTWLNQRYQTLVTAADLAHTAGTISGLGFSPCDPGLRLHSSLKITFSHVPPGYVLQAIFENNLPTPVVVLEANNYSWGGVPNTWNEIGLQSYFPYDGFSDLVIEVIAQGNNFLGSAFGGHHRDTRMRVFATGWTGPVPTSGTISFHALKMEILMGMAKISLHGKPPASSASTIAEGCNGHSLTVNGSSQLGSNQLDVLASGAGISSPIVLNIGVTNGSGLFPISLTGMGFTDCFMYNDLSVPFMMVATASGTATVSLGPVPNSAALIGCRLYVQFASLDAAAPGGLSTSNYARIVVGN